MFHGRHQQNCCERLVKPWGAAWSSRRWQRCGDHSQICWKKCYSKTSSKKTSLSVTRGLAKMDSDLVADWIIKNWEVGFKTSADPICPTKKLKQNLCIGFGPFRPPPGAVWRSPGKFFPFHFASLCVSPETSSRCKGMSAMVDGSDAR